MAIETTIPFDNASNFTFDTTKIEIAGSIAQLNRTITSQSFTQTFSSSVGFSFDVTKAEFTSGVVQQLDQTPTNSVWGTLFDTKDLNWNKSGSTTGTLNGIPTFSGGVMICTGTQGVFYNYTTNATESHKFIYTPNYSGTPPTNVNLHTTWNGTNNNDRWLLTHSPSGTNLRFTLNNSAGATVISLATAVAGWSPVAGTDYEFEVVLDSVAGTARVFVDGVLLGTNSPGAWSRGGVSSRSYIGASPSVYNQAEGSFDDYLYFSDAQHSSSYTPGYTVPSTIYDSTNVDLPQFTHTPGVIQAYTGVTSTESNSPRYTLQVGTNSFLYWNGTAWVSSDSTYTQASSIADVNANIGTLTNAVNSTQLTPRIHFNAGNTQMSVDNWVANYDGDSVYPTDNPEITQGSGIQVDEITEFSAITTQTGSDEVRFILNFNSADFYWDGASWSSSDGSFAQSNTAADVNANISSFDLSAGGTAKWKTILHSNSGSTTPSITSLTFCYNFFIPSPTDPSECIVYGWEYDSQGDRLEGATITASVVNSYFNGNIRISPRRISTTTNSDGYWEISLIETTSTSESVLITITTSNGNSGLITTTYDIVVPNQISAALSSLIS